MSHFSHTLIFILTLLAASSQLCAQCTPDQGVNTIGVHPFQLPNASVGTPYEQTATLVFPIDTVMFGFTNSIDSIQIDSIGGLPQGLSYTCETSLCTAYSNFPLLPRTCIAISGSAQTESIGDSLEVYTTMWITLFGAPTSLSKSFFARLDALDNVGISELSNSKDLIRLYPNPSGGTFQVTPMSDINIESVELYSLTGRLVFVQNSESLTNGLVSPELLNGQYIVRVRLTDGTIHSQRLIVQR